MRRECSTDSSVAVTRLPLPRVKSGLGNEFKQGFLTTRAACCLAQADDVCSAQTRLTDSSGGCERMPSPGAALIGH